MPSTGTKSNLNDPDHIGLFGTNGILFTQAQKGILETARSLHSKWCVKPLRDTGYLSDPFLKGVVTVDWPFKSKPAEDWGYPIVNLSNNRGPRVGAANFLSDDAAIGRMAVDFFRKKGINQLMVLGIAARTVHEERFNAAVEHGRASGMTVRSFKHDYNTFSRDVSNTATYAGALRDVLLPVLKSIPLGSAVFCSNDWLAIQILLLFRQFFPEHLDASSVLGVDNDAETESYFGTQLTSLSSIVPAFREMGADAFRWISENPGAAGVKRMSSVLKRFPPLRVAERGSTAAGGCADPLTARMIRWAWNRVQNEENVSVTDMARIHHLNLKSLERRFQEHAGCTAVDLIARLKLNLAKSLLRETQLPISEISYRCGYSKQDVLSRTLRAAEGCTPREYRNR